jgi:hypothetical protein
MYHYRGFNMYGYIKDNKVVYAGRTADGIWKGSKGVKKDGTRRTIERVFEMFSEEGNPLKEIIIPSNFDYHFGDYHYLEQDGKIIIAGLTDEARRERERQIDLLRIEELKRLIGSSEDKEALIEELNLLKQKWGL